MATLNAINRDAGDFITTYDLTGGNTTHIIPVSGKRSLILEVVAGIFNYPAATPNGTDLTGTLDGTVDLTQSADGVNKQAVTGATQIVLDSAQKVAKFELDVFNADFLHIDTVVNLITAGTVRFMYTFK